MKIVSSLPLLVAFTLAGCGGSSDDDPPTPPDDPSGETSAGGSDDGGVTDGGDTNGGGTETGGGATTGGGVATGSGATSGEGTETGGTTTTSGGTATGGGTTTGDGTPTGGGAATGGDTATGGGTTTGDGTTDGGTATGGGTTTGGGATDGGMTDGGGGGEMSSNPLEALEAASRIDADFYSALVGRTQAVETAGRFTSENYLDAFAAASQVTRGNAPFSRAEFLALLERQILAGESPLSFLNITEGSFNRVHLCPDGGRLLARKDDDGTDSLIGSYTFEECEIGSIFADGSYSVSRRYLSDDRVLAGTSFSRLRIDGADDIATVMSVSMDHDIAVTDDGTGGEILSTDTSLRGSYAVGIADIGVAEIAVFVSTEESVGSDDDLEVTDVLAPQTRSIRILTDSPAVDDTVRVAMSSSTSTNLAEAPESSDFEQGEMDFTIRPATNRLTVQVANGDPDSFDAFILEADNSVVSFTIPWDDGDFEFGSGQRRLPVLFDPR